jgi:xanthine dehydrogenase accessory factor
MDFEEGARLREFHERLGRYLSEGRVVVVATIVTSRGSTPRKVGTKMIIQEDGTIDFTLGGGPFEALVIEDAKVALARGEAALHAYSFLPVGENSTGMTCGGEVEVFLDVHKRAARVVIFGGGHVALPLARLAKSTGFRVAVIDDRAKFANRERFPEIDEVIHAEGGYVKCDLPLEDDDYVVVVTRCHQTDEACLRRVLDDDREPAYLGVVASKRKAKVLLARLVQDGYSRERLERVRSPVGLDIGAESPEEMAVSILGEIIATRCGKDGRSLSAESSVPRNVTVRRVPRPLRGASPRTQPASEETPS